MPPVKRNKVHVRSASKANSSTSVDLKPMNDLYKKLSKDYQDLFLTLSPDEDPGIDVKKVKQSNITDLSSFVKWISYHLSLSVKDPNYRTAKNFALIILLVHKPEMEAQFKTDKELDIEDLEYHSSDV